MRPGCSLWSPSVNELLFITNQDELYWASGEGETDLLLLASVEPQAVLRNTMALCERGQLAVYISDEDDDGWQQGQPPRRGSGVEQSIMTDDGDQMELYEERPPSMQYAKRGGGGSRSGTAGSGASSRRSGGSNKSRERQRRGPEQFDGDSQWRAAIM